MGGLFGTLQIGKRGVLTHRFGMDTVGHNLSNANTEGYSRQRLNLKATNGHHYAGMIVGQGVEAVNITRMRDTLVDRQVRYTKSNFGYSETQSYYFSKIEGLFPEPSDYGLQAYMGNFFSELRNVTNNPQNLAVRNTFVQSAVTLAGGFQHTSDNIDQLKQDLERDVDEKLLTINAILEDIYELNTHVAIEQAGNNSSANDLQDQRDLKLDELSKYINISVKHTNDGVAHVASGGTSLVRKNSFQALSKTSAIEAGKEVYKIIVNKTQNELKLHGGEVKGAVDVLNSQIPSAKTQLNDIANALITELNQLHEASYTLGSTAQPSVQGIKLFHGNSAGSMTVNNAVVEDVSLIAVSASGDPGNSEGGLSMLDMETAQLIDNKYTLNQSYGFLVSEVGLNKNSATVAAEGNLVSLSTFEGDRDSVTGVSVDEELTELIKVQRAFEASSKIISTVDRLMETMLAIV